jgi:hypothetical protein
MKLAPVATVVLSMITATFTFASSKVEIQAAGLKLALPHVEATRLIRNDGSAVISLLFAEKKPVDVVLVDEFGGNDLSLAQWTAKSDALAVLLSFKEGDEENFSLTVHVGAENNSTGGHHSGDGMRGVFRKLDLGKDRISGTLDHAGPPSALRGAFETDIRTVKEPAWVSGAALATSAQAKVLLAYAAAMRKMDFATATKYSVRDEVAETEKTKAMMDEKRMKSLIAMEFGTTKEFEKLLASADASMAESATKTKIRLVRRDGSSSEMSTIGLEKVGGEWKVNW